MASHADQELVEIEFRSSYQLVPIHGLNSICSIRADTAPVFSALDIRDTRCRPDTGDQSSIVHAGARSEEAPHGVIHRVSFRFGSVRGEIEIS